MGGVDPESPRYSLSVGGQSLSFYRELEAEAAARKVLTGLGLKWVADEAAFVATGDAAVGL